MNYDSLITGAADHLEALKSLVEDFCRAQGLTVDAYRGLRGYADVTCSAGHEFAFTPIDLLKGDYRRRPKDGSKQEFTLCSKCLNAEWVAECLTLLRSVAKAQGVDLTATDEEDESGDGHVVFAAKCSKGHHFKTTGRSTRNWRGDPVDVLCPDCWAAAASAEGFAKVAAVVRETRSMVVKKYRNAVDIRCLRGHPHTFYVDSWDRRQAIRPDFCGACSKLAKFREFSDTAKDFGITVLESQWIAASRPHRAICFAGHEFGLAPNKMKRGCPKCPKGMYGGIVPPHSVYYVVSGSDAVTGEDTVKPGISSGKGYNRLKHHTKDGLDTQNLRIVDLPAGMARRLEQFVLSGLDEMGWLSTRGVEYFPIAAMPDVMDLAAEWFTDQPGLAARQTVVDVDELLDPVGSPPAYEVLDVDVSSAVVFDSEDAWAAVPLAG